MSVLNRRVPQPEYLILRLKEDHDQKKDHDQAIFLPENPKFGEIIKLLSERFKIQTEVKQPNLRIVAASLGIIAIGNLIEKDFYDIFKYIINALQLHEDILKKRIDVWLE